jgi:hypothetical protein
MIHHLLRNCLSHRWRYDGQAHLRPPEPNTALHWCNAGKCPPKASVLRFPYGTLYRPFDRKVSATHVSLVWAGIPPFIAGVCLSVSGHSLLETTALFRTVPAYRQDDPQGLRAMNTSLGTYRQDGPRNVTVLGRHPKHPDGSRPSMVSAGRQACRY